MRKDGSPPTVDLKLIEGKVDDIFKKQNIWLFSFFWSFFCSGDFLSKQMKTRVYHLGDEALYLPIRGLSPLLGDSKPTYSKVSRCAGPLLLYILTFSCAIACSSKTINSHSPWNPRKAHSIFSHCILCHTWTYQPGRYFHTVLGGQTSLSKFNFLALESNRKDRMSFLPS